MRELKLWKEDSWLEPYKKQIWERYSLAVLRKQQIAGYGNTLDSALNAHLWYGCNPVEGGGYAFREWAPNATAIYLIGDVNGWKRDERFRLKKLEAGNWELITPKSVMEHGSLYKWLVCWDGGEGERIPAYSRRAIQDEKTKLFSAQVWNPQPYQWKNTPPPKVEQPLVYEAHIGMSSQEPKVATFNHFRENILKHIAQMGYNTVQLMALQEHPYYASFGYQVSNFYSVSSRFGTPEELKRLVDEAHGMGLAVIMDIVHSHATSNTLEGLSSLDGTPDLYFHKGERGHHPAWQSRCFDYGKEEVLRFLLCNCKYWLNEFCLDGFRFDGVTSMIYHHHGLGVDFQGYDSYFNGNQDNDAIVYLTLANTLVQEINPNAITIAEDVSGMPGLAAPIQDGGVGFNFRLSMGIADLWIKWIKEKRDEDWNMEELFYELTRKREDEKTISYAESHDQAMVGDKTIIFRLLDSEMYTSMSKEIESHTVERAIALHKMIRLITIATAGNGYLNFMGNEFGHPEWIDFPREGNNWSYHYARRDWSLATNPQLRYSYLMEFDKKMISLCSNGEIFAERPSILYLHNEREILIFSRGEFVFAFNFSPLYSYPELKIEVPAGNYKVVLDTDSKEFGGFERNNSLVEHPTLYENGRNLLPLYLPSRSALLLKK